jgi:hypothetical protein
MLCFDKETINFQALGHGNTQTLLMQQRGVFPPAPAGLVKTHVTDTYRGPKYGLV